MKTPCKNPLLLFVVMAGVGLLQAGRVTAQTFTTLHSFTDPKDGAIPYAGLISSGSTLYGTTSQGGNSGNGTVFAVNSDGTGFTILHSFPAGSGSYPNVTNSDGAYPYAGLILSGNALYGTTVFGGSSGNGTVFRVNTNGTGFTNLHSFTFAANGTYPNGLVLLGNALYGTAGGGGSFGFGTVFRVNTDGTGFTNLHNFSYGSDGAYPSGRLLLSGNTLYGTAGDGGSWGFGGTVFAISTDGTGFRTVHSFDPGTGEVDPEGGVILAGNTLYGITSQGRFGAVFAVNIDGSNFTNLYHFTPFSPDGVGAYTNSDGAFLRSGVLLLGNSLYGTARGGGSSGFGTMFKLNTNGTGFTNLRSFTNSSDGVSPNGLILLGNTLYGTAGGGGSSGFGTVFAINADGTGLTNLHSFTAGPVNSDGKNPQAGLTISGNTLYGAADSGGSSGNGAVFKVNADGTGFTTVHNFSATSGSLSTNSDGAYPDGTLILSGSTLYGTAYNGGTSGNGTVFKVNTNGTGFTTVHSFSATSGPLSSNSDGANPEAGLVISGNTLFGTTENGGTSGYGAVFAVNINGTGFTNLHSFTSGSDGDFPEGLLLSGNTLYGITIGFVSGNGTVFKVNTNGTGFTVLHTFTATNFSAPNGGPGPAPYYTNNDGVGPTGLILSGNTLYGTTYWGGTYGNGTVFKINTDGTDFTNLHSFVASHTNSAGAYTNSEGTHPIQFSGLVLLGGTLYGTAYYGGSSGNGTLFALNTNGTAFTTLHNFTTTDPAVGFNDDGANPYAGLMLSGTTLYGTAKAGGSSGYGTVFSLSLGTISAPQLTIVRSGTNVILTWSTNATGFTLQSSTNLVSPATWISNSPPPIIVNGQNAVTNPVSATRSFYRLIK